MQWKKIKDFMFLHVFMVFIKTIQLLNCDMKDSDYILSPLIYFLNYLQLNLLHFLLKFTFQILDQNDLHWYYSNRNILGYFHPWQDHGWKMPIDSEEWKLLYQIQIIEQKLLSPLQCPNLLMCACFNQLHIPFLICKQLENTEPKSCVLLDYKCSCKLHVI